MRKLCTLLALALSLSPAKSEACSAVMVRQKDASGAVVNAINARSMDFENQLFYFFGFGAKGTENISGVNFFKSLEDSNKDIAHWKNKHQFLGRTSFSKECLVDGLNDAGVYAAFLFLPGITEYPEYDKNDPRKAISHSDVVNYILGMAGSVDEALSLLKNYQIVNSAAEFKLGGKTVFTVQPLHVVIRDKTGSSALIEYRNGKKVVYSGDVDVVTNAPFYDWQIDNFKSMRSQLFKHNDPTVMIDGLLMNGSGLADLPGSFMPPDRFLRAKTLVNFFPTATTKAQAMVLAQQAIENVKAPFGATEAPSIFVSMCDLGNTVYYFKGIAAKLITLKGNAGITATLDPAAEDPTAWEKFNVSKLVPGKLPPDFLNMQTTRRTTYINPNSPKISYAKGVGAKTTYKTNLIPLSDFTDQLVLDNLFPNGVD